METWWSGLAVSLEDTSMEEFEDELVLALCDRYRNVSIACRDNVCAVTVKSLGRNRIHAAENFLVEHARIFTAPDTKEEVLIHASF
jgi:hypothetical protein